MLAVTLKQFLTTTVCPPTWSAYDLYLFRDETLVFYVGQSQLAFERVWRHLHDGFKGRSLVGKFVRVNWPRSMNFVIELYKAQDPRFADLHHDRTAAEAQLIMQWQPCFNATLNHLPTPLAAYYQPPTAVVRYPRNMRGMIREAGVALQQGKNETPW